MSNQCDQWLIDAISNFSMTENFEAYLFFIDWLLIISNNKWLVNLSPIDLIDVIDIIFLS